MLFFCKFLQTSYKLYNGRLKSLVEQHMIFLFFLRMSQLRKHQVFWCHLFVKFILQISTVFFSKLKWFHLLRWAKSVQSKKLQICIKLQTIYTYNTVQLFRPTRSKTMKLGSGRPSKRTSKVIHTAKEIMKHKPKTPLFHLSQG